jgi:hypothetical protein
MSGKSNGLGLTDDLANLSSLSLEKDIDLESWISFESNSPVGGADMMVVDESSPPPLSATPVAHAVDQTATPTAMTMASPSTPQGAAIRTFPKSYSVPQGYRPIQVTTPFQKNKFAYSYVPSKAPPATTAAVSTYSAQPKVSSFGNEATTTTATISSSKAKDSPSPSDNPAQASESPISSGSENEETSDLKTPSSIENPAFSPLDHPDPSAAPRLDDIINFSRLDELVTDSAQLSFLCLELPSGNHLTSSLEEIQHSLSLPTTTTFIPLQTALLFPRVLFIAAVHPQWNRRTSLWRHPRGRVHKTDSSALCKTGETVASGTT